MEKSTRLQFYYHLLLWIVMKPFYTDYYHTTVDLELVLSFVHFILFYLSLSRILFIYSMNIHACAL